jgi:REP element-mobilizing transposase RayT
MPIPDPLPRDPFCNPPSRPGAVGKTFLVTFHTVGRAPIFADSNLAASMAKASVSPHVLRASRLLCWVLMPDHWQGLVELGAMDALSPLVARIKIVSARAVGPLRAHAGAVWDAGFDDHPLYSEGDILDRARRIVMSPVRAGLVERVGLYPFWGAHWLEAKPGD